MIRLFSTALLACLVVHVTNGEPQPPAKTMPDIERFQGTWLFDEATLKKNSELLRVWESVVTVKGDTFTLTKVMGTKNGPEGHLNLRSEEPDVGRSENRRTRSLRPSPRIWVARQHAPGTL